MSDGAAFHDRDYSTEFAVTLEWWEWNRVFSLARQGVDAKHTEDWGDDEFAEDDALCAKLATEIGANSPGNGMADWPDSMKRAYDETVTEMLHDLTEDDAGGEGGD